MTEQPQIKVHLHDSIKKIGQPDIQVPDLASKEAVRKIFAGEGHLHFAQVDPPMAVLEELQKRVENKDAFGPKTHDEKTYELINEHVLRNGILQDMVGGKTLHWAKNTDELLSMARSMLSNCSSRDEDVILAAEKVLVFQRDMKKSRGEPTSISEQEMDPLVMQLFVAFGGDSPSKRSLVEPEWGDYSDGIVELSNRVFQSIRDGFIEARILMFETTPHGAKLVSPELAPKAFRTGSDDLYSYLMTRDLPAKWFRAGTTLAKRKGEARRWVEGVATRFDAEGKRASGGDYQSEMMRRFDLSETAAKDVWRIAAVPNRGKLGNIPDAERVGIEDLRAL
ncbi:hypothetical protein SAMN05444000_1552 [Shimia gijangensis]|uniref:Uncharacterized protein n=1 Tax=Shimia gijangensis TaxID=1470563 RepID=A0A1M6U7X8_9RHOB|nr:hypothetical protein [Shimia gijangensis]SHK65178.1 hypothetical protein SAMN05444000_1552 [Shimia gijangensis]